MSYEHDAYENNNLKFTSQTTPTENETICRVTIPPKYVCPVIFIHGIMGSNLINKNGDKVWFPPNGSLSGLGSAIYGGVWRSASSRQKELNPEDTFVSNEGEIKTKTLKKLKGFNESKARDRLWGTVWWEGYGDILVYLERYLNQELISGNSADHSNENCFMGTDEWKKIVDSDSTTASKINEFKQKWKPDTNKPFELLTKELHGKLADYNFPVFALSYNWLQSNGDSATKIVDTILSKVQAQIKIEYPKQKFQKYIIVTHSMGGLVTRAIIQDDRIKDDILGVVHGVMPATGSPTVYQRFCNGWDGYRVTGNWKDAIGKYVFGASYEKMTAVLGNSCGALQLLPFPNFEREGGKKAWLTLKALDLNGKEIIAELPKADSTAHEDIYSRTDTWWSMIDPNALDPAKILAEKLKKDITKTKVEDYYLNNIKNVEKFQNSILTSYHPNSYAHYGSDENHKSFNEIVWETKARLNITDADDLIEYVGASANTDEDDKSEDSDTNEQRLDMGGPIRITRDVGDLPSISLQATDGQDWFTGDGVRTIKTESGKKFHSF